MEFKQFGAIDEPYIRRDILSENESLVCDELTRLWRLTKDTAESKKWLDLFVELRRSALPLDLAEQDAYNAMLQKQLDEVNEQLKRYE